MRQQEQDLALERLLALSRDLDNKLEQALIRLGIDERKLERMAQLAARLPATARRQAEDRYDHALPASSINWRRVFAPEKAQLDQRRLRLIAG